MRTVIILKMKMKRIMWIIITHERIIMLRVMNYYLVLRKKENIRIM
jgi:hypothetical protein